MKVLWENKLGQALAVLGALSVIYTAMFAYVQIVNHSKQDQLHFINGEKPIVMQHVVKDDLIDQAKELENIKGQLATLSGQYAETRRDLEEIKKILYRMDSKSKVEGDN